MKVKTASIVISSLLIFGFLFLPKNTAYAWPWDIFTQIGESFAPSNIRKTMVNATVSVATDVPSQALYGRNLDQLNACMDKINKENGGPGLNLGDPPPGADVDVETDDCSDLSVGTPVSGRNGYPTQTRSLGSLMGMTIILEDISQNETEILNLAYYTKHMARKIPVINQTAYAADQSLDNILMASILKVWEKIRNLSYGILGLFMVGIGVMIMLRHKINPQSVVTVQYAIPRIIIAVILITFSYPIGALALKAIVPLSQLAYTLLNFGQGGLNQLPATTIWQMGVTGLVGYLSGLFLVLVLIIYAVVMFYFVIRILIQILLAYVKIAVSVLVAPFVFSWGAVPGNEEVTMGWFKGITINLLSIPAMAFVLGLHKFIGVEVVGSVIQGGQAGTVTFLGAPAVTGTSVLAIVFLTVLQIGILLQGVQIPAKIEEAINGPSYKGKGKKK